MFWFIEAAVGIRKVTRCMWLIGRQIGAQPLDTHVVYDTQAHSLVVNTMINLVFFTVFQMESCMLEQLAISKEMSPSFTRV